MERTDQDPTTEDVPVAIVGGGLGGLAAAAFLANGGVTSVVLERHAGPTARPRAWVVSPRTLEVLRALGIDREVLDRGSAGAWDMVMTPTLATAPVGEPPVDPAAGISADGSATCDQDVLEEVLRSWAVEHGSEVRWDTSVVDLVQRDGSVDVVLEGGDVLRARAVVLADGARAGLLPRIGITSTVPDGGAADPAARYDQVLFRSTQLDDLMRGVPGNAFVCTDTGAIVFRRDLRRWQLQRQGASIEDPARDIAAAVGRAVDVDVLDHSGWTPSARSADRYRAGDVFLVGDSARAFPPSLGMGGNLAIADAHNLAWKLVWVLAGRASDTLLDSYEQERAPIGALISAASIDRIRGRDTVGLLTAQLGLGYPAGASAALVGDGDAVTTGDPHDPTPVVGARLPHRWLDDGRSTVDLATVHGFVAVGRAAEGPADVPYTRIADLPAAGSPDAVWLVRPDGHVAAHIHPDEVAGVLERITGR